MMQKHVEQTSLPHSRKLGIPPSYSSQQGGGGLDFKMIIILGLVNNIHILNLTLLEVKNIIYSGIAAK